MSSQPTGSRQPVEDIYPLSPTQDGMLFHALHSPGYGVYLTQYTCVIRGLDLPLLAAAFQRVIDRHPALRTAFVWRNTAKPMQVVGRSVLLPLEERNWEPMTEAERESELAAYLAADRARGFDPNRAPLTRLAAMRIGPGAYRLVWSFHHLILDGWCRAIVLLEALTAYEALVRGEEPRFAPARPYRDYIAWLQRQDMAQAEAFWRAVLAGFTAPTPLRVDHPVDGESDSHAGLGTPLTAELTESLQAFARRYRLTLNTLVQGAWALLLGRYSGEPEVVYGTVVSGRPAEIERVESIVGNFINTLPVRVSCSDAPLLAWLAELQRSQAELRHFEYSPLVQVQKWSEVQQGTPLFESMFVFENFPQETSFGGGLELEDIRNLQRAHYPLVGMAVPGERMQLRLLYGCNRFDEATIERALGHFATLLEGMMAAPPGALLSDISMLTAGESRQVLLEWNGGGAHASRDGSFLSLFTSQAGRTPEAVAVASATGRLTYRELDERSDRLGARLLRLGVSPEVRVGILLERSVAAVVAVLAVWKAGGAYVPLAEGLPPERLAFLLADSGVSVLLTEERLAAGLPTTAAEILRLDAGDDGAAGAPPARSWPRIEPESLAYVIYTSGSTGRPKGVAVEHRQLVQYMAAIRARLALPPAATYASVSSLAADLGNTTFFLPLMTGGRLHLLSAEEIADGDAMGDLFARLGVDCLKIVPSHLAALMACRSPERLLPHRCLVLGGEAADARLVRRIRELAPACDLFNHYGPTESTIGIATYRAEEGEEGPLPLGRPLGESRIYLVGAHDRLAPVGVPAELCAAGPGLARGYLGRPDLTAERFRPDPFGSDPGARLYRTGDRARYRPDGVVEFLGRVDHQVKIRGFRVEPQEVAAVLTEHPGVAGAVVVHRPDHSGGRQLVAYAVPRRTVEAAPQPAAVGTEELREHLAGRLPDYMIPFRIHLLDVLPMLPSGKIDLAALPEDPAGEAGAGAPKDSYVAPRTPVEESLARIWSEVLGVERVGVHDNFFQLGGDSILNIQIVARAHRAGLRLSPSQLFKHPTLAELARVATAAMPARRAAPVSGRVPLTPIQEWFFARYLPAPHHFAMPLLVELREPVSPAVLETALAALLDHHDALRIGFRREGDQWMQWNEPPGQSRPGLTVLDLRALPAELAIAGVASAGEALQAGFDLGHPPLVHAGLFQRGSLHPDLLLLAVHHLVVDGVSWRILVEDLALLCGQLERGEAVSLPPRTTSFKSWAERLHQHVLAGHLGSQMAHWRALAGAAVDLPLDFAGGANTFGSARAVFAELPAEETEVLLRDIPPVYATETHEVLLAALARVLCAWTGRESVLIDIEGHGREDLIAGVDLTRTVGWLTTHYPVLIELGEAAAPGEDLKAVKEQLRAVPDRGIGFGALRYLSGDEAIRAELRALPLPQVKFNYLGRLDQGLVERAPFALSREDTGAAFDRRGERAHPLEFIAGVSGGSLWMRWVYSESLHRATTIQALSSELLAALKAIFNHCLDPEAGGYTPSDFPEAGLDQQGLEAVLGQLLEEESDATGA